MKGNELVWRALADRALAGDRTWANVNDLAFESGVPLSTAHLALDRLTRIGAIDRFPRGGLSVVSIEKILTLQCAWRNLEKDTMAFTTREGISPYLDTRRTPYALGGPDAATTYLAGSRVADFSQHIVYLPPGTLHEEPPRGEEVRVLEMDKRAARLWTGYSSPSQTYADLFASPGWQSSEFRKALHGALLPGLEWDQQAPRW